MSTLAQELDLTAQERAEVEAIQTTEGLAAYFEKIPRDYDVQIIISEDKPGCTSDLPIQHGTTHMFFILQSTLLT